MISDQKKLSKWKQKINVYTKGKVSEICGTLSNGLVNVHIIGVNNKEK